MTLKNNLLQIRLKLGFRYSKDFAIFLDINISQYSRYESNNVQPELPTLCKIYEKIKIKDTSIHLEDLIYYSMEQ